MQGNYVNVPPEIVEVKEPKVKKPMNPAEKERNERRKAAFAELRALNPKARWTNASKLVSFRNAGKTEEERAFMEAILMPAEAAGNAAAAQAVANNKPVGPAVENAQNAVISDVARVAKKVERKFTRNNAKKSLMRVMDKYKLKPSGSLIQKFLGLHRRGDNNAAFLADLNQKTAKVAFARANKTVKKAKKAPQVLTQTAWRAIKDQVNRNVAASGMRLNAINRRALTIARKNRPDLGVRNFMMGRPARIRTRKVLPKNVVF